MPFPPLKDLIKRVVKHLHLPRVFAVRPKRPAKNGRTQRSSTATHNEGECSIVCPKCKQRFQISHGHSSAGQDTRSANNDSDYNPTTDAEMGLIRNLHVQQTDVHTLGLPGADGATVTPRSQETGSLSTQSYSYSYSNSFTAQEPGAHLLEEMCQCMWCYSNGLRCNALIRNKNLPAHLREVHQIHGPDKLRLDCKWEDCGRPLNKESVARHIRENHLRIV